MLISLLVVLIVLALVYWAITQLPLPPMVRSVAIIIVVLFAVMWLISLIDPGLGSGLFSPRALR